MYGSTRRHILKDLFYLVVIGGVLAVVGLYLAIGDATAHPRANGDMLVRIFIGAGTALTLVVAALNPESDADFHERWSRAWFVIGLGLVIYGFIFLEDPVGDWVILGRLLVGAACIMLAFTVFDSERARDRADLRYLGFDRPRRRRRRRRSRSYSWDF